jgi:3-methyladenine DNA glycosylase/8-oxoguanine DNA glycosylase
MTPDEQTLYEYVLQSVGDRPEAWPGGWPDQIESALIYAVFSVRARYGNRLKKTGVYGAVMRWQDHRQGAADNLAVLAKTPETDLRSITNAGKVAGRTKAQVVIDAAQALTAAGVLHAADFLNHEADARAAYLSVKGCGPVTWAYFRMLLGHDDVKPDTWVQRFVQDKIPTATTAEQASRLVHAVAAHLDVDATALDHAIWRYRREHHR